MVSSYKCLLLKRDRSVSLRRDSRPSIFEMLLKDRSSHSRFVKCEIFSIFSMILLSSCNLTRPKSPLRLSILSIFWKLKLNA